MQIGFLNGKGRSDRENQACGTAGAGYGQYAVKYFTPNMDAAYRVHTRVRVAHSIWAFPLKNQSWESESCTGNK